MRMILALAVVTIAGHGATAAQAFEYHGYFRSGIGFSRGGTDQVCFRAPGTEGASGKFRLGNECETYVELSFSENHGGDGKGSDPFFKSHVRIAMQANAHRDWEPDTPYCTGDDCTNDSLKANFSTSFREAYGEAMNLLPWGASFWAGKRFYKRRDIHMMDYYLVENAGPGFGFENFTFGCTKIHLAAIQNIPAQDDEDGPAQTNVDLRADIDTGHGVVTPIIIYGAAAKRGHSSGDDKYEPVNGVQASVFYNYSLLGGFNTVGVQYGQGIYGANPDWNSSMLTQYGAFGSQTIAKGDDDRKDARDKSSTLRVVEHLVIKPMKALSTGFVILYQDVNFGGYKDELDEEIKNKVELSTGIRPVWHVTKGFDLALEYGLTSVADYKSTDSNGNTIYKDAQLNKVTIAPTFVAGDSYWARPQLRLFATYASWDEGSKGQIGGDVYAGDKTGFSGGAQIEVWW